MSTKGRGQTPFPSCFLGRVPRTVTISISPHSPDPKIKCTQRAAQKEKPEVFYANTRPDLSLRPSSLHTSPMQTGSSHRTVRLSRRTRDTEERFRNPLILISPRSLASNTTLMRRYAFLLFFLPPPNTLESESDKKADVLVRSSSLEESRPSPAPCTASLGQTRFQREEQKCKRQMRQECRPQLATTIDPASFFIANADIDVEQTRSTFSHWNLPFQSKTISTPGHNRDREKVKLKRRKKWAPVVRNLGVHTSKRMIEVR